MNCKPQVIMGRAHCGENRWLFGAERSSSRGCVQWVVAVTSRPQVDREIWWRLQDFLGCGRRRTDLCREIWGKPTIVGYNNSHLLLDMTMKKIRYLPTWVRGRIKLIIFIFFWLCDKMRRHKVKANSLTKKNLNTSSYLSRIMFSKVSINLLIFK